MLNRPKLVQKQYSDDKKLSIRSNLHLKYSTNKKGFVPWLFEHYQFQESLILELGCGNGIQWDSRLESLPNGCNLILSDLSGGMVEIVQGKYRSFENVSFERMDIQNISFPDETFDVVIANHMLYHVPDLSKALSEVHRVLRKGGKFYCSTNGNGGMWLFIAKAIQQIHPGSNEFSQGFSFSLQNGGELLSKSFIEVEQFVYEDSLSITDTQDLIAWIKSSISFSMVSKEIIKELTVYFENLRNRDGSIIIPKEAGLFVSTK